MGHVDGDHRVARELEPLPWTRPGARTNFHPDAFGAEVADSVDRVATEPDVAP
jgi:hypothetical protein